MISEEKVKIMSALARYEKNEGASDSQVYQYSRKDFVRKEIMKVGVAISIAYVIGVMIFFGMNFEVFVDMIQDGKTIPVVIGLLLGYMLVCFGYIRFIKKKANQHYSEAAIRMRTYEKNLEDLVAFYDREENEDNRPTIAAKENTDGTDIII